MIRTIHFSLCEEVWRGIIRISPNAFSLRVGFLEQGGQPMDLHRFWDGVITGGYDTDETMGTGGTRPYGVAQDISV
jgi:hypothetical protein